MNLYHISQGDNNGYDTYDSAIVCAEDEIEARGIHPSGDQATLWFDGTWTTPDKVRVRLIGTASEVVAKGVVCASFNAG